MKHLTAYVRERKALLLLLLLLGALFCLIAFLYCLPLEAVLYILEVWTVILFLLGIRDYVLFCRKIRILEQYNAMEMPIDFILSEAEAPIEREYQKLIEKQNQFVQNTVQNQIQKASDLKDYYAIWTHQIKTPISAILLMLQIAEEYPSRMNIKVLKNELFKIDFYTDAAMDYLRLEDTSSDFHFDTYEIKGIITQAVKKFSTQFIHKKISLKINCNKEKAVTDQKWLGFLIEQLLSNAVKYTEENGSISIDVMDKDAQLNISIKDTGIGIRSEDLPRIMERGYTGYNGRMNQKSSGIGLYLCKKAADKMGAELKFSSEPGKGTTVTICLKQRQTVYE